MATHCVLIGKLSGTCFHKFSYCEDDGIIQSIEENYTFDVRVDQSPEDWENFKEEYRKQGDVIFIQETEMNTKIDELKSKTSLALKVYAKTF